MIDFLFWVAMAGVFMLGWPEIKEWWAVRRLRRELKEYDRARKQEDRDVSHL